MRVQNKIDRFNIVLDVLKFTKNDNLKLAKDMRTKLKTHNSYIKKHGKDMPEILEWKWE